MARCENCGNEYDKSFRIIMADQEYTFDSFECAIHKLAPRCVHCATPIVGHGVESNGRMFCCVHCSSQEGVKGLKDRE